MQYIGLLIAAVLVGVDRLTKWLITSNMQLQDSIHIIEIGGREVLNLTYYTNDGAAFSKFEGQTAMLIAVTSAVLIVLIGMLLSGKVKRTPYIIAFSMVIGGGAGNLIDRIFNNGRVVDFIDFRIINFAVFNFADICAVCGALLILFLLIRDDVIAHRKKRAEGGTNEDNTETAAENGEN